MTPSSELGLDEREGLPDALRVLLAEFPRLTWAEHPNFGDLTKFWLSRHAMFRELMDILQDNTRGFLDGKSAPEALQRQVHRYGYALLAGLHEHHGVEDHHYFPLMRMQDARLARGFDLLDADHQALDTWLADLSETAQPVLNGATPDTAGKLLATLDTLAPLLHRHLEDEEDLIVPVILKTGMR
ncbi:MAG: hemerythrin domain-containing protein [Pseudomonadota bacterium]